MADLENYIMALKMGCTLTPSGDDLTLADGTILAGNASNLAAPVTPSGDVTMTRLGVYSVGAGKVTNAMQKVPKVVVYQEVCPVASFDDSGASAVGFLDLDTTIPAGAVFLSSAIHAIVGFAGDTSAVITLGDGSDVDRYNTGTPSVFTTAAAGVAVGAASGTVFHAAVKTPRVYVTGATDFSDIVTDGNGSVTVTLVYIQPV